MIVIIDGPEAVGKSTIVAGMSKEYALDRVLTRRWGPVPDWGAYIDPLSEDVTFHFANPYHLIIWDRSWAAELVYNGLLNRGRIINPEGLRCLEDAVRDTGGLLLMADADPDVLVMRRAARVERGEKPDLPVDPMEEREAFLSYAKDHRWTVVRDVTDAIEELKSEELKRHGTQ